MNKDIINSNFFFDILMNEIKLFLIIIGIIFTVLVGQNLYNLYSIPKMMIDVVYTWVDQNDPERIEYQKKLLNKTDKNLESGRYSNIEELKYSIRSLEQNCPWVRNIYIVVKDGQNPAFIDFSNPNIKLIKHSEIMPPSALPTFNSLAIELCIHKIKGLSDYYVYMNDDFFIMKPTKISEFIDFNNNVPIINLIKPNKTKTKLKYDYSSEYAFDKLLSNTIIISNMITKQNLNLNLDFVHLPSVCYKPWDEEIESVLKKLKLKSLNISNFWTHTVESKFRKNDNILLNMCLRPIYYAKKGATQKNLDQYELTIYLKDNKCILTPTLLKNIKFLCLNEIDNTCARYFKKFINQQFNKKSQYEL